MRDLRYVHISNINSLRRLDKINEILKLLSPISKQPVDNEDIDAMGERGVGYIKVLGGCIKKALSKRRKE